MRKFLKKLLELVTEDDNKTLCPVRFAAMVAFVIAMWLQVHATYYNAPFNIENFGIGVGSLLAGLGGGRFFSSTRYGRTTVEEEVGEHDNKGTTVSHRPEF